jgi:hypothetical protein
MPTGSALRWSPPLAESAIAWFVLLPGAFQYNTKELVIDGFGNGIVALALGGVVPQLKTLVCPGKGKMVNPLGKVIVSVSVSVAVPLQGSFATFVALMATGKVPVAVGVPEISPGVQPSPLLWQMVKPPGKPIASKLVGLLLAVI